MKFSYFKIAFLGLILLNSVYCTSQNKTAALTCDQLKGKKFSITSYANGKAEGAEILSFDNGKLEGSECIKYGFVAANYTCQAENGQLTFTTTMNSEKEGVMVWHGTVKDSQIEGTTIWTKAGQAPMTLVFNNLNDKKK
jgi:hypothetical protein